MDFYIQNKNLNGVFVVESAYPTDAPAQVEGYIKFLRDKDGSRCIVVYYSYHVAFGVWKRPIFHGEWIADDWMKLC